MMRLCLRDAVLAIVAWAVSLSLAPWSIGQAAEFYVAPDGDDANRRDDRSDRCSPSPGHGTRCGGRLPAG